MHPFRLARVAAEAERLRIKRIIRHLVVRAILGAIAGVFALAALAWLHMIVWYALAYAIEPLPRSAVMVGIDLVILLIFALLAMRSPHDPIETEALEVRRAAVAHIRRNLSLAALAATVARAAGRNRAVGSALGSFAARLFNRI